MVIVEGGNHDPLGVFRTLIKTLSLERFYVKRVAKFTPDCSVTIESHGVRELFQLKLLDDLAAVGAKDLKTI